MEEGWTGELSRRAEQRQPPPAEDGPAQGADELGPGLGAGSDDEHRRSRVARRQVLTGTGEAESGLVGGVERPHGANQPVTIERCNRQPSWRAVRASRAGPGPGNRLSFQLFAAFGLIGTARSIPGPFRCSPRRTAYSRALCRIACRPRMSADFRRRGRSCSSRKMSAFLRQVHPSFAYPAGHSRAPLRERQTTYDHTRGTNRCRR